MTTRDADSQGSTAPRRHRQLVAMAGAGHSGSTLLGLALGAHPEVFYAGEAKKSLYLGDPKKPLRKRVCKLCGPSCRVWGALPVPPEPDLYEALAQRRGVPVVVDSTKDVRWIRRQRATVRSAGAEHRLLLVLRDGRAVVNSRLRKTPDADPVAVVDRWLRSLEAAEALAAERPEHTLRVRYERLATAPEATLRQVMAFLRIPFDAAQLRYEEAEHHPLGGNTGTQSLVARSRGAPDDTLAVVPARSRDYYQPLERGFHLDRRWETELSPAALAVFEARAGARNRAYAWEAAS